MWLCFFKLKREMFGVGGFCIFYVVVLLNVIVIRKLGEREKKEEDGYVFFFR